MPRGKPQRPMVGAEFIVVAERRLNCNLAELGRLLGVNYGSLHRYRKLRVAPLWLKVAVNGLLAEQAMAKAEAEAAASIPGLELVPTGNKPFGVVPTPPEEATGQAITAILVARVPLAFMDSACRMLSGLGATILVREA